MTDQTAPADRWAKLRLYFAAEGRPPSWPVADDEIRALLAERDAMAVALREMVDTEEIVQRSAGVAAWGAPAPAVVIAVLAARDDLISRARRLLNQEVQNDG